MRNKQETYPRLSKLFTKADPRFDWGAEEAAANKGVAADLFWVHQARLTRSLLLLLLLRVKRRRGRTT